MPDGHGPLFSGVFSCLVGFISKRNPPSTLRLILEKWEVPSLLRLGDLGEAGKYLPATVVSLLLEHHRQVQVQMQDQIPAPDSWSTATEM